MAACSGGRFVASNGTNCCCLLAFAPTVPAGGATPCHPGSGDNSIAAKQRQHRLKKKCHSKCTLHNDSRVCAGAGRQRYTDLWRLAPRCWAFICAARVLLAKIRQVFDAPRFGDQTNLHEDVLSKALPLKTAAMWCGDSMSGRPPQLS